ncbi:MAG: hypothetical protein ACE37F_27905 [Nannocystaceae bacterium]|nr:carboxypeptidase-like regulatory domain-containing protein [bacterium]
MNTRTWLGLLATAVLVGLAVWSLRPRDPAARSGAGAQPMADGTRAGARGGGGVRAAEVDVDASITVRGEVIDADGQPVTGGALLLRCLKADRVSVLGTVRLDDDGAFEGPGCRGQVCATLSHAAESPAEPWVLRPGTASVLRTMSLARLWGEVVTPSGEPVEAARVIFAPSGPADERDPTALMPLATRSTTTDADGRFVVAWIARPPCGPCEEAAGGCAELPPMVDALEAIASAPGHASGRVAFDAQVDTSPDAPLRVTLQIAADLLTGQLLGADGHAYPRAYVLARSLDRPREQRRAEVDADGNFEIDGLGPGRYALRALQDGVELATAEAETGADVELSGSVDAHGPDLEVTVLDEDGRYAQGAIVDGGPFRGTKTDMKGKVRMVSALPGSVTLRVRLGPRSERVEVEIPQLDPEDPAHSHRVEVRLGASRSPDGPLPGL